MTAPFDRQVFNTLEAELSQDPNYIHTANDLTLRALLRDLFNPRSAGSDVYATPEPRFIGDGFKLRPPGGMSFNVSPGNGFFYDNINTQTALNGIVGIDDTNNYKPLVLGMAQNFVVTAPVANSRIDILEVRTNRAFANPQSRNVLNPNTGALAAATVNKSLTWALDGNVGTVTTPANSTAAISYKIGTPSASPIAPPVTTGYTQVGQITLSSSTAAITAANLIDTRMLMLPYGAGRIAAQVTSQTVLGNPAISIGNISAPPGVFVGALYPNISPNVFYLVIAGGVGPSSFGNGVALLQSPGSLAPMETGVFVTNTTINSTLQAALNNQVAIGQQCLIFEVYISSSNYATIYSQALTWNVLVEWSSV